MARTGPSSTPATSKASPTRSRAYARDPALRARHGAAGLAYAETQDWDRINSVVLKTYQRVIERRERYARLTGRRTI